MPEAAVIDEVDEVDGVDGVDAVDAVDARRWTAGPGGGQRAHSREGYADAE